MDVSGYQPSIDWSAEAAKGAKFAYVKASEGIDIKSKYFSSQYTGSRNVGMVRGAYHFAWPGVTSASAQADFFVNNGGQWSADGWTLPPLLDVEYNPYGEFGNSCYNLSTGQMVSWIRAFSDRILARTGRLPMIYTTSDWWKTCTGDNASFGANGLHIAAYNTWGPEPLPAGWSGYKMWQYSDQGPFAGDSNVWNGSLSALKLFATKSDVAGTTGAVSTIAVGDINGDGRNDAVSVTDGGQLLFHAGSGNGKFASGVGIGTGWNVYTKIIGSRDVNGDGRSDLLALRADGSMWFYAGTGVVGSGSSGLEAGRVIGSSTWAQYTSVVAAGDVNSDGKNDLIATKLDGTLWLIPGLGTVNGAGVAFGTPSRIGSSGWDSFIKISGGVDLNSDGVPDVLATRLDGTLWFYAGTGQRAPSLNVYATAEKIGTSGWNQFHDVLAAGDLNGDGKPDVVGVRPDGVMYFYAGTGMRDHGYSAGQQIGGSGWNSFKQVLSAGDLDSDGVPDLLAIDHDGSLWQYPGNRSGGYKPRIAVGSSWNAYMTVIGAGDLNGDSKPDLLAIRPDGTLWFYSGTGRVSANSSGYAPALKIGTYWNSYKDVVAVGDMNGDGKADLMATRGDGSLWFYAGVGSVSSASNGFAPAKNLVVQNWGAADKLIGSKDFDSDGRNDILTVDGAGALWFRAGTGSFASGTGLRGPAKIGGSGWTAYDTVLGVGDTNLDGKNDLVGINNNGSLWFYMGTGMKIAPFLAGVNLGVLR
ncbi:GH25 family lysozyme [Arthrobacter alpinus]|nr:GH25 family lysozyme [Arthrobacter alpinus]